MNLNRRAMGYKAVSSCGLRGSGLEAVMPLAGFQIDNCDSSSAEGSSARKAEALLASLLASPAVDGRNLVPPMRRATSICITEPCMPVLISGIDVRCCGACFRPFAQVAPQLPALLFEDMDSPLRDGNRYGQLGSGILPLFVGSISAP